MKTKEQFFKVALDILKNEEFVPGMPLFEEPDFLEDFEVSQGGSSIDLDIFLSELYDQFMEG